MVDFETALDGLPRDFLAAAGRARVLELRGDHTAALAALESLRELAQTDWQRAEIELGLARIFDDLGQSNNAARARDRARRLERSAR